jgi:hypothetical protein
VWDCPAFCMWAESWAPSRRWSRRWVTGSCSINSCSVWLVWLIASSTCGQEQCKADSHRLPCPRPPTEDPDNPSPVCSMLEATSGHRLSTKIKRWEWERCRSASCPTSTRQIGHTLYLLHSECADGGPVNLQNAVPRMDGIAVVSTNVHPVYSKTQELREGEDLLKTHPNNSAFSGNTHQIPGPDHPHKKRRHHS